jgi:hypothetical protein
MHKKMSCRYDWHQTAVAVVVAIYAKKYSPVLSKVLLSPVRLTVDLYFPEQGSNFNMDIELCGVSTANSCLRQKYFKINGLQHSSMV